MHLNSTHLVRGGARQLLQKRGFFEAELLDPAVQAAAPLLVCLIFCAVLGDLAFQNHMPAAGV